MKTTLDDLIYLVYRHDHINPENLFSRFFEGTESAYFIGNNELFSIACISIRDFNDYCPYVEETTTPRGVGRVVDYEITTEPEESPALFNVFSWLKDGSQRFHLRNCTEDEAKEFIDRCQVDDFLNWDRISMERSPELVIYDFSLKRVIEQIEEYCDNWCDESPEIEGMGGDFIFSELGQQKLNDEPDLVQQVDPTAYMKMR